jgi:ArsR family metal-binding transcriptional regulator
LINDLIDEVIDIVRCIADSKKIKVLKIIDHKLLANYIISDKKRLK